MENLVFSLNATMPVFLLMVLGMVFRRFRIIDDEFAARLNAFVFHMALPVLLFGDMARIDIEHDWNGPFVAFCFAATAASIALVAALSLLVRGKSERGEFVQSSYRSSAALLGVALMQNIYGSSGMAALMIVGAVPLYNIAAVFVLAFTAPGSERLDVATTMRQALRDVIGNPIIIGIAIGLLFSLFGFSLPPIAETLVDSIGGLATPLGLLAMGAMFDLRRARAKIAPAMGASGLKLVGLGLVFLPVAVAIGFRGEELATILIMLASPTTVSCFVMARAMRHDGLLSSTAVMLTTLGSAFTLTAWLFVLRSIGLM